MANVPTQWLSTGKNKRFLLLSVVVIMVALFASSFGIPTARAASACTVKYTVQNQWPTGFTTNVDITNSSATPFTAWTLTFTFPAAGQQEVQGWNATWSQAGQVVTAASLSYNGNLAPGATTSAGFNGAITGANPVPTDFAINGNACNGAPAPTPTPTTAPPGVTPTPTTVPPGPTPTTVPPGPTPTPAPPGTHLVNPFVGAKGYVNPQWAAEMRGAGVTKLTTISTAVWLDSMSAISSTATTMGLQAHLDAAVTQAAGAPMTVEFVIYDLPNRDCSALASNGELLIANNGLNIYKTQYIDPIAAIMANPKYSNLRIITFIEPDSLPNLITNLSFAKCQEANSTGAYVQGVQYALNKLHAISNVYTYLDAAHSGWLGWATNMQPAVQLWASTVRGTTAGFSSVDGFVSDTANTTPVQEPFLTNPNQIVGGSPVNSSTFFQFNPTLDELSYDTLLRSSLISAGFSPNIGMIIDTSRNGWGGAARPTAPSTATDVNTFVNQSRIDRRPGRGDWCNQNGAGLGARPAANPLPGIAAFVWVKPPGESDGSSSLIPVGPNNPGGKGFDSMCDPAYGGNALNNFQPSGALPNAPVSGMFFPAQLQQLVQNAFPPL